nr:Ig-like domain-containing protein [Duganella sp. BJB1802]
MVWWKFKQAAPVAARTNQPARLLLQALEPRLMFDGAAVQSAISALHADAPHAAGVEAPVERFQQRAAPQANSMGVMAQPVAGVSDFNTVSGPVIASGSSAGDGLSVLNIDGWDFLLKSSAATNCYIGAETLTGQTIVITGVSNDGAPLGYLQVSSDNNTRFTLASVDIGVGGISVGSNGVMRLQGYRNGAAVSGATMSLMVTDANLGGQLITFNVSNNSSFEGIDAFRVQSDGSFVVTGAVGVDNIVATDFFHPGPVLAGSGGSAAYRAGDGNAVVVDGGITLSSTGADNQASATVAITGNFHSAEDLLAFTNNNGALFGNISGSYNNATGALTLTSVGAGATNAQWQAALEAVTYRNSSPTPLADTRTISFAITDNGGFTSTTVIRAVTVSPDVAPAIGNLHGDSVSYTAGGGAVHLDSGVAAIVSDSDTPNFNGGWIAARIVANAHSAEDVLGIDGGGAVSLSAGTTVGSTVSVGGVAIGVIANNGDGAGGRDLMVTFNGNASAARVSTLAGALTYNDIAGSPNTATRTVQVVVNDGHGQSSSAASITVAVINAPVLTPSGGSAAFSAGDNVASTPVAIDGGITVADPGSATLASASVAITGNFRSGEDVLAFANDGASMGNIAGSYNSGSGVLTLTSSGATATLAQWQAALRAVKYTDTAITPNTATRTISIQATDGNGQGSAAVARTVTVAATDQTPIATASGGGTVYSGGDGVAGTPVVVDGGITLSDLDNTTLASATVAVTGNFRAGEDVLAFSNVNAALYGNIVASYNSGSGVLTMTSSGATATLAQWQAALRAVRYSDSAVVPNAATRTVSFTVDDGTKSSATVTRAVTVAAAAQTPVLTVSGGSAAFTAGDNGPATPVALDGGLTLSDLDSATLASATVAITGNFRAGEDSLAFSNGNATLYGNIGASYNNATGVLTMSSAGATATLAQWQAALRAVTYSDSAVSPDTSTRTVSLAVSDGGRTSASVTRTVTVGATDQTPIIVGSGGGTAYAGADGVAGMPVVVDGGLTLSDLDNTTLASATVAITGNFQAGEDVLAFSNGNAALFGNIAGSYNGATGVLTMTSSGATATLAQWQAALRTVSYGDSAVVPNTATRTVSFAVNDGSKTSAAATRAVTVTAPDQTPDLAGSAGSAHFTAGDGVPAAPVAVDAGLTVGDRDNTTLAGATVAITGNFRAGEDVLAFTNNSAATFGNITASYAPATGVLTLASSGATATLAQWQAALRAVTYTDSADTPNLASRTVSVTVSDGSKSSVTVSRGVTLALPDYTPVVVASGGQARFLVGAGAAVVDAGLQVSDRDSATLAGATVAISGNFHAGQDVLAFVNNNTTRYGNIAASYNGATGVLSLTSSGATATVAQWQAALRSVSYANSAGLPDMAARTVSFSVNDGGRSSQLATHDVQLALPAPQIAGLAAGSDSGASASDGVTSQTRPTVGGTALAGALVTVSVDGAVAGTAVADGGGAWSYTFTNALVDGTHSVTATIGSGGFDSPASGALTLVIDTQAPVSPADIRLSGGARPVVSGTAEAGSTIAVFLDGVEAGRTQTDAHGAWSWQSGTALADGQHSVRAVSTDLAGNAGAASSTLDFVVDTRVPPPPAPTLGLAPGSDSGSSASDGLTRETHPTVGGTAQAGSTVAVSVDGVLAGTASVGTDGGWSYKFDGALADGAHTITAVASNAGGPGAASAGLSLVIDTAAPAAPVVAGMGGDVAQPQVTGSAEALSTVIVYVDNVQAGTVQADAGGSWSYRLSAKLADGGTPCATAGDAAGNMGASSAAQLTADYGAARRAGRTGAGGRLDTGASGSDGVTGHAPAADPGHGQGGQPRDGQHRRHRAGQHCGRRAGRVELASGRRVGRRPASRDGGCDQWGGREQRGLGAAAGHHRQRRAAAGGDQRARRGVGQGGRLAL